ncbi:MAG: hypothetical protein M1378_00780 [Bacteroidetes bacterium]|nr:hypothetical protein [Bacteroidota bacterium]
MKRKKPEGVIDPSKLTLENIGSEADPSCKKCYGRGWLGVDKTHGVIVVCDCILKRFPKTKLTKSRGGRQELIPVGYAEAVGDKNPETVNAYGESHTTEGVENEEGQETKEAPNQTEDAAESNLGENVGREVQPVGEGA